MSESGEVRVKAAVYDTYGTPDVVRVMEMPVPQPQDNEVLIRVRATTVTAGDWRVRSLTLPPGLGFVGRLMLGYPPPRQPILGSELSGVIDAIGRTVTRFKVGDEVVAFDGAKMGCHAEFKVMAEDRPIVLKPASLGFDEAAAQSFGGTTALHFLRKANIQPGQSVLVVGASGSVGTALVQLAKHFGAIVTGVTSTSNADLVRSIGADEVIDYTAHDFATGGKSFDIIADATGTVSFPRARRCLKRGGRLLQIAGSLGEMLMAGWYSATSGKKVITGTAPERTEDLQFLADLAEQGRYRPVIDSVLPLSEIVEAHRIVDSGRKRGNVVVTV